MSIRQNVHTAKCPYGEMSYGEISYGEMSHGEMSYGDMSVHGMVGWYRTTDYKRH